MKYSALIGTGLLVAACLTGQANAQLAAPEAEATARLTAGWDRNFTISENPELGQLGSLIYEEKAQNFQWGGNGRWKMNLDVLTRPEESPLPREEMRAGATYQFTPRFSLGGSVSVGAQQLDNVEQWKEQDVEAGVRLKTTLKF